MIFNLEYLTGSILFISILFLLGFIRINNYSNTHYKSSDINLTGYILRHSTVDNSGWIVRLKNYNIRTKNKEIDFGDFIEIDKSKCEFKYNQYFCDSNSLIFRSTSGLSIISNYRNTLMNLVYERFHEPYAGLLLGMLIGYRSDNPDELDEIYRKAGIMHIIVASGFNVNIIISIIFTSLSIFSNRKIVYIVVLLIIFYVFIVGLEIPILRAVITAIYILFARYYGERPKLIYILLVSSLLILIFMPYAFYSLSFWMSFTAVFFLFIGSDIANSNSYIWSNFKSI